MTHQTKISPAHLERLQDLVEEGPMVCRNEDMLLMSLGLVLPMLDDPQGSMVATYKGHLYLGRRYY